MCTYILVNLILGLAVLLGLDYLTRQPGILKPNRQVPFVPARNVQHLYTTPGSQQAVPVNAIEYNAADFHQVLPELWSLMKEGDIVLFTWPKVILNVNAKLVDQICESGSLIWASFETVQQIASAQDCKDLGASWTEFRPLQAMQKECLCIQKRAAQDTLIHDWSSCFQRKNPDLLATVLALKNAVTKVQPQTRSSYEQPFSFV